LEHLEKAADEASKAAKRDKMKFAKTKTDLPSKSKWSPSKLGYNMGMGNTVVSQP